MQAELAPGFLRFMTKFNLWIAMFLNDIPTSGPGELASLRGRVMLEPGWLSNELLLESIQASQGGGSEQSSKVDFLSSLVKQWAHSEEQWLYA